MGDAPMRTTFFRDDHGRPLCVTVYDTGSVDVHLIREDGSAVPVPQMRNPPSPGPQSGTECHDWLGMVEEARRCPHFRSQH